MRSRIVAICLFCLLVSIMSAYDTGKQPVKAMALSAFLPAGGQFYNESYYKATGILVLEGVLVGSLIYNHYKLESYHDKAMATNSADRFLYYQEQYNIHFARRQNNMWWLGSVVFLSILDAFVDANLYNYEQERNSVRMRFDDKKINLEIRF